jgi:hypothetical protein
MEIGWAGRPAAEIDSTMQSVEILQTQELIKLMN